MKGRVEGQGSERCDTVRIVLKSWIPFSENLTISHRSHPMKTLLLLLIPAIVSLPSQADDWPQWGGPGHDGFWRETGIVHTFPTDGPKVLWRVPIQRGYAGPSVADGRVFVFDRTTPEGTAMPESALPWARRPRAAPMS